MAACLLAPSARSAPTADPTPPACGDPEDAVEVSFVDQRLDVDGLLLDSRFIDMDGNGRRDLVMAVRAQRPGLAPRRELRIHAMLPEGTVAPEPSLVLPVPDDVIVYGCADVQPDAGRELLLLTRSGAHSFSPLAPGLREGVRRLVSTELLFQVPSSRHLPAWTYVLERKGAHDLLVLPDASHTSLWGPRTDAGATPPVDDAGDYMRLADFGLDDGAASFSVKAPGAVRASAGGLRVKIDTGSDKDLFLGEAPEAYAAMLQAEGRYRAPALADVDGDGRKDLLLYDKNSLAVHLSGPDGPAREPSRVEALPAYLDRPDDDLILNLRDLDGDGDMDIYARVSPDQDGLEHVVFNYFVMMNDGSRLFPDEPAQLLRFEGTGTDSTVIDVDANGRPDLVITKYVLPADLQDALTGLRFYRSAYVYFAGDKLPFERKPGLRDEQSFSSESLQDALVNRHIAGDLSNDGIADLVEMDISGHVAIRRILYEQTMFGGGKWAVEDAPWKRFDLGTDLTMMRVEDVNGDGLMDILNPGDTGISLLLSRKERGPAR
ncbi:MAG: FG-GAP repeat domain-containing protein [Planctomycetota bacterium]